MAKASSPVRLQDALMQAATLSGTTQHRSAAEQIEYWADIGRRVSKIVDPQTLLEIQAGLVRLSIDKVNNVIADPERVMAKLGKDRNSGALARTIAGSRPKYEASTAHPGLLEQVCADGMRILGQFENGQFKPTS